ncbi:Carbonic anhydrase [Mesobacillus persicus]|uniref:Carbonic anhydrase n=1 Tax=Mesobacillus persicus TaxID=930146 RepID=A0A1H8B2Z1_9BACI|nr:carbonic anhydrase [Mesobacillus persicus]SEM76498.1 Carbonic anhydrase [Mesobacillus persicus]
MNSTKHNKALVLTDMESGWGPILQQVTDIQLENMFMIHSDGTVISHPYGDIMRSIVLAIHQENVEEIFVVGTKENGTSSVNDHVLFDSVKDKIKTIDYLFQNCIPEFSGGSVKEWLYGKENGRDQIEESVNIIRHHPLVPEHVEVKGFLVNKEGEISTVEHSQMKQLKQRQA